MRSTSNTRDTDNLLTPPVHASNQSQADLSMSRHLVRQAQLPQMTTNQADVGPSDSRQVTTREAQIQGNHTGSGSPMTSSPHKRQLTREELLSKIDKYSTKLREYAGNMTEKDKGKQILKSDTNMVSRLHQRILDQMLMITEKYNAKGFVFGMITETSKPLTGASDSLRAWWKREAMFDKVGPVQIDLYYKDNSLNSHEPQDSHTKSTTELLMKLSDPTLGSILSLLMQHCDPPQRKFPFDNGVPPPWWPTTQENWWDQTGISRDEGPPPFRKPHGLRKKWKVAVIVGIMKSMSPNYSRPYNLVEQSHHLQLRMNAKEMKFWTLALVAEAKQYCQEHSDMPADHEAIAFVEAYGPLAVPSNTPSAWPITVPLMGQPQQGVQFSTAPDPQMAMSESFFSYPPFVEQPGEAPSTSGTRSRCTKPDA
ncbi:EIN3-like protein [Carex littledalei]|uniref:EIN3-like protein n=1 Tax=Carex littledalei TaxID=544730 RepID=A0A833QKE9_9POAL|nr:EIN3-like protein [Carex littledalei]